VSCWFALVFRTERSINIWRATQSGPGGVLLRVRWYSFRGHLFAPQKYLTFYLTKHAVGTNALLNLYIYTETGASLSTRAIFYSSTCTMFDILVEQVMLHKIDLNKHHQISRTVDQGHCQHAQEQSASEFLLPKGH
jgi:hypothetical protein